MDLIERARLFATAAHGATGRVRFYTGEPYIAHPARVADLVASVPHHDEMIAAAFLHDVCEDTAIPLIMIRQEFGATVHSYVFWLTDKSRPQDGNRAERKEIERFWIAGASPEAKTIKLADLIDNTSTIVERDPKFAKVYLQEKAALLEVLREGNPTLWRRAAEMVERGQHVHG